MQRSDPALLPKAGAAMYTPLAPTLSYRILPNTNQIVKDLLLVLSGAALLAALAQVRVPLPFTPVPLTGQTFGVLLIGAALGSKRGAASLAVYLAAGLLGLPVFTGGGSGLAHLAGPTGGYLAGFVAGAYMAGRLAERGLERRWTTALLPFLAGQMVIYALGLSWLALFTGPENALAAGLLPFLPGDLLKLGLAALALPAAWKLARE